MSEVREALKVAERRLSADELRAWVEAPMSDAERQEILSLIDWFTRRYPTARERLAAARRSAKNALALAGRASPR